MDNFALAITNVFSNKIILKAKIIKRVCFAKFLC